MSNRVQAEVWSRYPIGVPSGEFILALALADHAADDGTNIFPSVEYSAKKTRQSVRSVQNHLRRMQQRGFLILVREAERGRTREYRIDPEWLEGGQLAELAIDHVPEDDDVSGGASPAPMAVDKLSSADKEGCNPEPLGCNSAHFGVQVTTENVSQLAPQPSYKHQESGFNHQPPAVDIPAARPSDPQAAVAGLTLREKFERFWASYPRKERPRQAWEAFCRIEPDDALFGWMLRAVVHQKTSQAWKTENGRWIPFAVNWLTRQQWKYSQAARVDQDGQSADRPAAPARAAAPESPHDRATGFRHLAELKILTGSSS